MAATWVAKRPAKAVAETRILTSMELRKEGLWCVYMGVDWDGFKDSLDQQTTGLDDCKDCCLYGANMKTGRARREREW